MSILTSNHCLIQIYFLSFCDIRNNITSAASLTFSEVEETVVLNLLEGINPAKAAGLDNIAGKFLKEGASVLATPLTQICNLSIHLSTFPDKCKQAKLKPLFKKGITTKPQNYRPISVTEQLQKTHIVM